MSLTNKLYIMSLIKANKRNKLHPWNPSPFHSIFNTDDFFSDNFLSEEDTLPAMNVKESNLDYEVELAAPGFSKKDFEVTIDNHILNISAEKKEEKEEKEDNFMRKEFSYSSFKRALKLPNSVNESGSVKATYKDGILKLNLLKKEMNEETKKVIDIE